MTIRERGKNRLIIAISYFIPEFEQNIVANENQVKESQWKEAHWFSFASVCRQICILE